MSLFDDVREWNEVFDVPIADRLDLIPIDRRALRIDLHMEEMTELHNAMNSGNLVEIADGLADLVWVLLGTALEYGIPFDQVWEEVRRSNFDKIGPDGEIRRRADGKILKPDTWTPPMIADVLYGEGE